MHPRIKQLNGHQPNPAAKYVLYWAQMNRRVEYNHALAYAIHWGGKLNLPVLCYEGLTCTYPYASDRLHTFILEGVPDMARQLAHLGVGYAFYPRKRKDCPDNAFYKAAQDAALIVTDDYPLFLAAGHNRSVPAKVAVPYYVVDSSCVVPMSLIEDRQYAAYTIRPKIKKLLPEQLKPLAMNAPSRKWDSAVPDFHVPITASCIAPLVAECEIDHTVKPSLTFHGGSSNAARQLALFLQERLSRYPAERNTPTNHATSDLSPYLHFGHISSLAVTLATRDYAAENKLMADEFLEELIVRRELAFNFARLTPNCNSLEALPNWVRQTLAKHDDDPREYIYTRDQFEQADTHDPLWNATQKELLLRGKTHGYYRMYWGKKIIEWSPTHAEAHQTMLHLQDKYALDGRDPNTYTNVLWCFGLHDRPWTERAIFGMIRYMGLDGMKRKTNVPAYLKEIADLERTGIDPFRVK